MSTLVRLTDTELVALDGRCRDEVQAEVDKALRRLESVAARPDLTEAQARLVADVVSEATTAGLLVWHRRRARSCPLCDKGYGYHQFKSGPRRGKPNHSKPITYACIELAHRFVRVENHLRLGCCVDCMTAMRPVLADALADVRAELPAELHTDGRPTFRRHARRRCPDCGWEGHEGEMRRLRTVLGDGSYPGGCPACSFESVFLGRSFESLDGFDVVEVAS